MSILINHRTGKIKKLFKTYTRILYFYFIKPYIRPFIKITLYLSVYVKRCLQI